MAFNHSNPSAGREPTTSLQQGLARLPAELWQQILDLTLDTPPPVVHIDDRYLPTQLHINRHTRQSFAPAYYTNTTFTTRVHHLWSPTPTPLIQWLASLTAEDRAAITEIRLIGNEWIANMNHTSALSGARLSADALAMARDILRMEEWRLERQGLGVGRGVLRVLLLVDVERDDGSVEKEERWMNAGEIEEMFNNML